MRLRKECAGVVGGGGAVPQGEEAATRWKADLIFDCFFVFVAKTQQGGRVGGVAG